MPAWLRLSLLLAALVSTDCIADQDRDVAASAYLDTLIQLSKEKNLASHRLWQVLLHYRANRFSTGVTSEVDGSDFFLAEDGKTNPVSELAATLSAYISNQRAGKDNRLAQCAFPARYHWLNRQLNFNPELIPEQRCEAIEIWRERLDAESVSLVFSSYYLNNPASMFGHTLMRFNSGENSRPELLDFTVNFAANADDADGVIDYAWRGLTGGFEGRFSMYPYYDMVKQYNNLENRDLWEYRLNLSTEQIDFMLLHVWELAQTSFDFLFLRENCSYHLLSLLEIANPELHLRDQYSAWTLPTETIRQIVDQPGMVGGVVLRPSLGSMLRTRLTALNDREQAAVEQLVDRQRLINLSDIDSMSVERQALAIDTAIDLIHYQNAMEVSRAGERIDRLHELLLRRSRLPVSGLSAQHNTNPQLPMAPHKGHDPARFELSIGKVDLDEFSNRNHRHSVIDFSIQPGFHDLLSREGGHAPNSQIKILNLEARYETESDEWQVQRVTLLDLISLYPLSTFLNQPSWKINLGWQRNQDGACRRCTPFYLNPGIGLSIESQLHHKEVYFAFVEGQLEFDHELDSDYRGGYGASVGLLFDASNDWRMALTANRTRFTSGHSGYRSGIEFNQRVYLDRNLELVLDFSVVGDYREVKLGVGYYF